MGLVHLHRTGDDGLKYGNGIAQRFFGDPQHLFPDIGALGVHSHQDPIDLNIGIRIGFDAVIESISSSIPLVE